MQWRLRHHLELLLLSLCAGCAASGPPFEVIAGRFDIGRAYTSSTTVLDATCLEAVVERPLRGAVQVYNEIISYFAINNFYMVGSSYWNFAFGLKPGEAAQDDEGMRTMDDLASNMAFLLKALQKEREPS